MEGKIRGYLRIIIFNQSKIFNLCFINFYVCKVPILIRKQNFIFDNSHDNFRIFIRSGQLSGMEFHIVRRIIKMNLELLVQVVVDTSLARFYR